MNVLFVYVTVADDAEAERISQAVVEERLAACANLLGDIRSVYWWDEKVCNGKEVAMILKTTEERKSELVERIKQLHSYDCPCITCFPITFGNSDFLGWIKQETKNDNP